MSSISSAELTMVDEFLRGEGKGYILDFSNRTMGEFFVLEFDVDILSDDYASGGTSESEPAAHVPQAGRRRFGRARLSPDPRAGRSSRSAGLREISSSRPAPGARHRAWSAHRRDQGQAARLPLKGSPSSIRLARRLPNASNTAPR